MARVVNKKRDEAWEALENSVRRLFVLDSLEVREVAQDQWTFEDLAVWLEMRQEITEAICDDHREVENQMRRENCKFHRFDGINDGGKTREYYYTVDKDGDGWYWSRVRKGTERGIFVHVHGDSWRSFRKRKDAKAHALKQLEAHKQRLNARKRGWGKAYLFGPKGRY